MPNLLKAKIAVLYVSLLPQFIDPDGAPVALQSLVLGATQIVIALSVNTLIVVFAGGLARFLSARPSWMRVQRYVMGGVLGALAVKPASDRSRTAAAWPSASRCRAPRSASGAADSPLVAARDVAATGHEIGDGRRPGRALLLGCLSLLARPINGR